MQVGGVVGVGDDGDFDARQAGGRSIKLRDGEGDAVDGDGALLDDVGRDVDGEVDGEAPIGGIAAGVEGDEGDERAGGVDVTLDDMAAEGRAGGRGEFQVDQAARCEEAEGRAGYGFGGEVGGKAAGWRSSASATSSAVRQTPLTAMLSPMCQRPASEGAAMMRRISPAICATERTVPVVAMSPVNML